MIVDFEVTNHTDDTQELSNMAIKAKETLGADYIEVLADSGYENRAEFDKCIENNIKPIVNIKSTEKENGCYSKDEFIYDRTKDVYICPNNGELVCVWHNTNKKGKRILKNKVYKNEKLCNTCEKAKECFDNKRGYRRIERWEKENMVDNMKTKEARDKLRKRKGMIEPIHGVIKRDLGYEYVLTRGLESVKAEFSLTALAYNFKRVLNILGFDNFMNLLTA